MLIRIRSIGLISKDEKFYNAIIKLDLNSLLSLLNLKLNVSYTRRTKENCHGRKRYFVFHRRE